VLSFVVDLFLFLLCFRLVKYVVRMLFRNFTSRSGFMYSSANLHELFNSLLREKWGATNQSNNEHYRQKHEDLSRYGMPKEEACEILGVTRHASKEEINQAFKKLMLINHPDKGGSKYIADKIIKARQTLLGA